MMVVDPFSAASKPIRDWDSIPSRPLPFAATLEVSDFSSLDPSSQRFPKPVRCEKDGIPATFPTPVYSPDRVRSPLKGGDQQRRQSLGQGQTDIGSDEWFQKKVEHCVDNALSELDVSGCGLTSVSTRIVDLRDLVTLQPQSPAESTSYDRSPPSPSRGTVHRSSLVSRLGERSFARTQSAPASANVFDRSSQNTQRFRGLFPPPVIEEHSASAKKGDGVTRPFTRSMTGAVAFRGQGEASRPNLAVYMARNLLTSLPSVLFEIHNITVLILRGNRLDALPAAIGALVHLKELNISNNRIRYLPSSITDLQLDVFAAHPNKWMDPPSTSTGRVRPRPRVLSPKVAFSANTVPRLTALCLTTLLSPRLPSERPPFVDFDWEGCRAGSSHPLLDSALLSQFLPPSLGPEDVERILQAVRSACGAVARTQSTVDRFPRSNTVCRPDDGSKNPYYRPCPSPRHQMWDSASAEESRVTRRIFLDAAEERFEWLTVSGIPNLPVQWLGCSPGCLDFLEANDDAEWPEIFGD